jgi:DHA1 family bicyclomycin/chloramphenicol resistance-like MFS transporter
MPNTTVLAMEHHGRIAGSASALLGSVQFALGATAATVAGSLGTSSAIPLGLVIAGCGCSAFLINLTRVRLKPDSTLAAGVVG